MFRLENGVKTEMTPEEEKLFNQLKPENVFGGGWHEG